MIKRLNLAIDKGDKSVLFIQRLAREEGKERKKYKRRSKEASSNNCNDQQRLCYDARSVLYSVATHHRPPRATRAREVGYCSDFLSYRPTRMCASDDKKKKADNRKRCTANLIFTLISIHIKLIYT